MTLKSTETRYKPNAFNNIHIIEKRVKCDPTLEWESWLDKLSTGNLSSVFGLTRMEAKASVQIFKHLPVTAREFYADAVSLHGMACHGNSRAPFSHSFLASPTIARNFSPPGEPVDGYSMENQESTTMLIAIRSLGAWLDAPTALRRVSTPELGAELQKICRAYEIVMAKFLSMIPAHTAEDDCKLCSQLFHAGVHDATYAQIAVEKPLPLSSAVDRIPEMKAVLSRHKSAVDKAESARRAEYISKVEDATMEQLRADLASDKSSVQEYYILLKDIRAGWSLRVLAFKRARRAAGVTLCEKITNAELKVVCVASAEEASVELAKMKAAQNDTDHGLDLNKQPGSRTYHVHCLDFSHSPGEAIMKSAIKAAAQLTHLSKETVVLLVYPMHCGTQTASAHLKLTRGLEDACLKQSLDFSTEISLHFTPPASDDEAAPRDNRAQFSRARLLTSESFDDSPWKNSDVIKLYGGRVFDLPLARVKELLTRYTAKTGPLDARHSPKERATQRGMDHFPALLKQLMAGVGVKATDNVFVVDYNVMTGEKMDGMLKYQVDWQKMSPTSRTMPHISMLQLVVNDGVDDGGGGCEIVRDQIHNRLITKRLKQWELSTVAGPTEPAQAPEDIVEKPTLHLATWNGLEATIPCMAKEKFPDDSEHSASWLKQILECEGDFKRWSKEAGGPAVNEPEGHKTPVPGLGGTGPEKLLSGPDLSISPEPIDLTRSLADKVEVIEEVDFPVGDV